MLHTITRKNRFTTSKGVSILNLLFQLECEAERQWPLFVYSILATFLASLIFATLQWLICGKKNLATTVILIYLFRFFKLNAWARVQMTKMMASRGYTVDIDLELSCDFNHHQYPYSILTSITIIIKHILLSIILNIHIQQFFSYHHDHNLANSFSDK